MNIDQQDGFLLAEMLCLTSEEEGLRLNIRKALSGEIQDELEARVIENPSEFIGDLSQRIRPKPNAMEQHQVPPRIQALLDSARKDTSSVGGQRFHPRRGYRMPSGLRSYLYRLLIQPSSRGVQCLE